MMPAPLRLEVDACTLARLLDAGSICAAEFRCLDGETKRRVWHLLLGTRPLPAMAQVGVLVAGATRR